MRDETSSSFNKKSSCLQLSNYDYHDLNEWGSSDFSAVLYLIALLFEVSHFQYNVPCHVHVHWCFAILACFGQKFFILIPNLVISNNKVWKMNLKLCVYICVCGREYNKVKKSLGEFTPCKEKIAKLRFLLHGPVGAGKSSTINSIRSVFKEEILTGALASTQQAGGSFTKNVSLYCKDNTV